MSCDRCRRLDEVAERPPVRRLRASGTGAAVRRARCCATPPAAAQDADPDTVSAVRLQEETTELWTGEQEWASTEAAARMWSAAKGREMPPPLRPGHNHRRPAGRRLHAARRPGGDRRQPRRPVAAPARDRRAGRAHGAGSRRALPVRVHSPVRGRQRPHRPRTDRRRHRRRSLSDIPACAVSVPILRHRQVYYHRLDAVRRADGLDAWTVFMLQMMAEGTNLRGAHHALEQRRSPRRRRRGCFQPPRFYGSLTEDSRGQAQEGGRSVEHQVGAKRLCDPPSDDAPREGVDDEGHVHETAPRRHVGQVGHPELVGAGGREVAFDQALRSVGCVIRDRRRQSAAADCTLQVRPDGRPLESCSRACSNTSRTARSRTSGEYRLGLPIDSILAKNEASRKPGTVHLDWWRFLAAEAARCTARSTGPRS